VGVSPVWIEGSFSWLQKLFVWVHRLVSSVMQLDTLLLSSWHTTQKEQEHGAYYEEDDYMEVDVSSKPVASQKRNTWRLLLLLLPLIFLAGKWYLLLKIAAHL
jgi:heme A synthase